MDSIVESKKEQKIAVQGMKLFMDTLVTNHQ